MITNIWAIGFFVWLNEVKPLRRLSLIETVVEVSP